MTRLLPRDMEVRQVDRSQDAVLRNLLNLYIHDMAEWFLIDSDEDGRYAYDTEPLWENGVDVHFVYHGRVPVGFALVGSAQPYTTKPDAKDLDEFFILRRHRRAGLGTAVATHVWDLYPGPWVVRVYQRNRPALPFWRSVVAGYTGGDFQEDVRSVRDRPWSYFFFDSASR